MGEIAVVDEITYSDYIYRGISEKVKEKQRKKEMERCKRRNTEFLSYLKNLDKYSTE